MELSTPIQSTPSPLPSDPSSTPSTPSSQPPPPPTYTIYRNPHGIPTFSPKRGTRALLDALTYSFPHLSTELDLLQAALRLFFANERGSRSVYELPERDLKVGLAVPKPGSAVGLGVSGCGIGNGNGNGSMEREILQPAKVALRNWEFRAGLRAPGRRRTLNSFYSATGTPTTGSEVDGSRTGRSRASSRSSRASSRARGASSRGISPFASSGLDGVEGNVVEDRRGMMTTWSVASGKEIERRRRMPYDVVKRKRVAENRGMACERHRATKTCCDPALCPQNKLYNKTAFSTPNPITTPSSSSPSSSSPPTLATTTNFSNHTNAPFSSPAPSLSYAPSTPSDMSMDLSLSHWPSYPINELELLLGTIDNQGCVAAALGFDMASPADGAGNWNAPPLSWTENISSKPIPQPIAGLELVVPLPHAAPLTMPIIEQSTGDSISLYHPHHHHNHNHNHNPESTRQAQQCMLSAPAVPLPSQKNVQSTTLLPSIPQATSGDLERWMAGTENMDFGGSAEMEMEFSESVEMEMEVEVDPFMGWGLGHMEGERESSKNSGSIAATAAVNENNGDYDWVLEHVENL